jgi:hypothetical protein
VLCGPFAKRNRPKAACPGWWAFLGEAGAPVLLGVATCVLWVRFGSKGAVLCAEGVRKLRGVSDQLISIGLQRNNNNNYYIIIIILLNHGIMEWRLG